jgi:hypothetical protein
LAVHRIVAERPRPDNPVLALGRVDYRALRARGARGSCAHVINNLRVVVHDCDQASAQWVADGQSVLLSKPPIMLTDVSEELVRERDGVRALQVAYAQGAVPGRHADGRLTLPGCVAYGLGQPVQPATFACRNSAFSSFAPVRLEVAPLV